MTEALNNLVHHCEEQPSGITVRLNNDYFDRRDSTWCLFIERQATEDDLEENHYLNEAGEIIWTTIVEISHCPYCGSKLASDTIIDTGGFAHIDFSGGTARQH
ncbi:hypothetical protein ACQKEM_13050 [Pseudomonas sp. NPDC077382]